MKALVLLSLLFLAGCGGCMSTNSHLSDCPSWLPGGWHNK